ncbi:uncharacterized protein AB675_1781 [Cyphellophora attinorum]|uniref:Pheromone-regulated membrane protein 10 n=1 Tax=Cyphellophora attinorum TaxID=1664694 RepID=A0A0N0NPU4_9EURO|nr:uncharacterized protein AB675_1781 [Phialophora attinorum]KPI43128.1 hypothetical protein AB675_1781 [Phialophora attinorum]
MATPERPLSPVASSSGASTPTYDNEKASIHTGPDSATSDLEAGLLARRGTSTEPRSPSGVSRVFKSLRWKPAKSSGLTSEPEHVDDEKAKDTEAGDESTTPDYTTEARQLVRSFTQRDLTRGYGQSKSGTQTPGIDQYVHDLDYIPAPEQYKPSIFGALLTSKLNTLQHESQAQRAQQREFYSNFESKHGRSRSHDRLSGSSTPKVRWYDKPESSSVTNLLAQATLSTTTPGLPNTASAGTFPRSIKPRPRSTGSEYTISDQFLKRGSQLDLNDALVDEVSDIIARRKYLTKLCGALMKYGAPTHRLEEYLSASARALAIDADFMFIPGAMMCTFIDHSIYANNVEIVRKSASLDLGKLKDVFNVYKNVIHTKLTAQEGIAALETISTAPDRHNIWFRILMFGLASVVVGPFSFNTRPIDFPPIFVMGCVLGWLQMRVVPRSEQFSNVFEVFACVVIAFVSRAIGSIKYPGSQDYIFCFSGVSQSSIAMILPGFMVLNSALELQSRNLVSGSVRMVYAIIYVLFLGFGLLVGTTIFGLIKRDAVSEVTCQVPKWFQADDSSPKLLYTTFVWAPLFACCVALIYNAKWRQLPVMALIAVAGHQANFWISTQLASNLQVANAIGAFVIGCMANMYSRVFHGLAAAAMLPAIYVQVPGGLAASGSLVAGIDSANQIFGNSSSISVINNGTQGFVAAQNDPNSVYSGTIFNVGYGMVQVAIGISVGLYLSALVVYPMGKRRGGSGLFSF